MGEIIISEFNNKLKVHYTNEKISLTDEYSEKVKRHWQNLLSSGNKFFNGDVFTINNIVVTENSISIFVGLTDYAHFLYTIHKNKQEIRDLIFVDAKKEAIEEFISTDKREKDGNLISTLEATVGMRQVLSFK